MGKGQTRKPSRDIHGGKGKAAYQATKEPKRGKGSSKGKGNSKDFYGTPRQNRSRGRGAQNAKFGAQDKSTNKGRGKGFTYKKDAKSGLDVIAGKHAVIEALEADVPLKKIMVAQGISSGEVLDKIQELAGLRGADIDIVPRVRIEEKAAGLNHQGILAIASGYEYSSIHQIIESSASESAALVIVLDHITDVGNFGAIARTAEVLGASGVVIANKRSVDVVSSTYKTSAGAVSRIKIAKVTNIANTCDTLRDCGFWIAGASEKAQCACWDSSLNGKIALVMGNEQTGISKLVQQKCDFMVKLEQRGQIGSLNVSCAMAALGYEWLRQCASKGLLE